MAKDFLVELGTEELPPKSLLNLAVEFCGNIERALVKEQISFTAICYYATPRRLAVAVDGLVQQAPDQKIEQWGPPLKVAFDQQGQPTKAAQAFASKNGLNLDDLKNKHSDAGKLVYRTTVKGATSVSLLPGIVQRALDDLPIAKRMRWGSGRAEFVRPVQWLVMLYDGEIVEAEIYGASASRHTRGHRFHANQALTLSDRSSYEDTLLNQGKVIVDFAKRQATIVEQVTNEAKKLGGTAVISDDLLEEVCGLVEWPVALAGKFDKAFLTIPAEALISSMKEHQKYFHVVDESGQLLPYFITVANLASTDPAQVIDGNERVIRPRLADAAFFFNTDKQATQLQRREKLKTVMFQAKLGSIYQKTERVDALSQHIAKQIKADSTLASRAAQLSKADLVSSMVYEFPDMQGTAGYHYALHDGEHNEVASAIAEQYLPKFAGDALAQTTTGSILALADRLDTITGIFGIGQIPTGSKDPFALRRASLGALRIMVEKRLDLDLRDLLNVAASQYTGLPNASSVVDDVLNYMLERFKAWYGEAQIAAEVFQAVSAKNLTRPLDIDNRVKAVAQFYTLPEAAALASANKRVSNILAKHGNLKLTEIDSLRLVEPAEKTLYQAITDMRERVTPLFAAANYAEALSILANLRQPVDAFFDDVMVMAEDIELRNNRLALLQQLRELFLEVADISLLAVKS